VSGSSSPPARRLERPRWLDPRLLVGLFLVLASVAVGSRVVASAEEGELVWSAARDLPAGTTLEAGDMEPTSVRLAGSTAQYVDAGAAPPTGYVLLRDVTAGELVPAAALATTDAPSSHRLVAVPVAPNHFPPGLVRGHRVDVYVTSAATPGSATTDDAEPRLVLADASVAEVADGSGAFGASSGSVGIVLEVDESDAAAVVAAVATGTIQLVRLPGSP
jgi:hypothetical protein